MKTIIQDFFNDIDDTYIQDHKIDINHTGDQWRSNNLKILNNELIFNIKNIWGAYINLIGNRLTGTFWIYIDSASTYDFRFMIKRNSSSEYIYFQIHSDTSGTLFIKKDSTNTILMQNTDWNITIGWKLINFIIEPDYIEFDLGETDGKIYLYDSFYSSYPVLDFYADSGCAPKINTLLLQEQDEDFSDYSNVENVTISALTIQEIWEQYSEIEFKRQILIKRLGTNELYENDYQDIINLTDENYNMFEVCKNLSFLLPNNSYSLGQVIIRNAELNFINLTGEFNDENTVGSIFQNFIRHKTLIKIVDSFIDKYTYPDSRGEVLETIFEGFIDDRLCQTSNKGIEKIIVTEILSTLLKELTWGEIKDSLTQTNLDNILYEIMNRDFFTDFFIVSAGNINPGYNATGVDKTQYEDSKTILEVLQNLSIGHSIFYVKDGIFYYKSDDPTGSVQINFGLSPERKIKIDKINNGAKIVKDKLYWKDSVETYFKSFRVYNEKYEFDIPGITVSIQRQNLLNYIGPKISESKRNFSLTIPFLPTLKLLDKITLERVGSIQDGSWILDCTKLDEIIFLDPITTLKLTTDEEWKIIGIEHKGRTQTILSLEEVI